MSELPEAADSAALFARIGKQIAAAGISTSTLADVLDGMGVSGAVLHSSLRRLTGGTGLFYGRALTVKWVQVRKGPQITAPGPSTWRQVRDFLVPGVRSGRGLVYVAGAGPAVTEAALAGGLSATYLSRALHFEGAVLGGAIRDRALVEESGLPVVATNFVPTDTQGAYKVEAVAVPCVIENTVVGPGDWVFSDANGTVIVRPDSVEAVLREAARIEEAEHDILRRIEAGEPLPAIIDSVGRI